MAYYVELLVFQQLVAIRLMIHLSMKYTDLDALVLGIYKLQDVKQSSNYLMRDKISTN